MIQAFEKVRLEKGDGKSRRSSQAARKINHLRQLAKRWRELK